MNRGLSFTLYTKCNSNFKRYKEIRYFIKLSMNIVFTFFDYTDYACIVDKKDD